MFWFQIPTWENPGGCICICRQDGSQIWLILKRDYWGGRIGDRGRRLIDFCKTGQKDSPQSPFCPNTLSAVCRLRGISRSGGAFYQICKSPSTTNQQTLLLRTVSIPFRCQLLNNQKLANVLEETVILFLFNLSTIPHWTLSLPTHIINSGHHLTRFNLGHG